MKNALVAKITPKRYVSPTCPAKRWRLATCLPIPSTVLPYCARFALNRTDVVKTQEVIQEFAEGTLTVSFAAAKRLFPAARRAAGRVNRPTRLIPAIVSRYGLTSRRPRCTIGHSSRLSLTNFNKQSQGQIAYEEIEMKIMGAS
jgi:hypothetical protein